MDLSTMMKATVMVVLAGSIFAAAYQTATGSAVLGWSRMDGVVAERVENAAILTSGPGRLSIEVDAPQHEFRYSDNEARVKPGIDALQGPGIGTGKKLSLPEGQYSASSDQDIAMSPLCLSENPDVRFSKDC
nr:MAG: hypothetical protein J07AB56_02800 [Candidatus Nanosalinarum sp. J07AB56]